MIEKILERLREKFKYNSEQAEIWREGSDTDAYFREKKDLYLDRANTYGEAMRIVQEVAKEYGNGWIPCSERLPELTEGWESFKQSKCCLVTVEWWDGDMTEDIGWYNQSGVWNLDSNSRKVIAWQPLPAPYQKGE